MDVRPIFLLGWSQLQPDYVAELTHVVGFDMIRLILEVARKRIP